MKSTIRSQEPKWILYCHWYMYRWDMTYSCSWTMSYTGDSYYLNSAITKNTCSCVQRNWNQEIAGSWYSKGLDCIVVTNKVLTQSPERLSHNRTFPSTLPVAKYLDDPSHDRHVTPSCQKDSSIKLSMLWEPQGISIWTSRVTMWTYGWHD